ncbi:Uncharacterised protein [uncultured archaeon]|nr:Uncharacterised protein [uncultured archaeon]
MLPASRTYPLSQKFCQFKVKFWLVPAPIEMEIECVSVPYVAFLLAVPLYVPGERP